MNYFKNNKITFVILIISLIFNIKFIATAIINYNIEHYNYTPPAYDNKDSTASIDYFKQLISSNNSATPYTYYSTWATFCTPCIKEMPRLDSIMNNKTNYFNCLFLIDDKQERMIKFLNKKNIKSKNFNFLSNGKEFIGNISKYKKNRVLIYPTQIIFNKKGNIVYYHEGDISFKEEIIQFSNTLDSLITIVNKKQIIINSSR